MWKARALLLLSCASLLAGCADVSSPEPALNVNGRWRYYSTISNASTTCTIETTLQLTQAGKTFEGEVSGGIIRCNTSGLANYTEIGSDIVLNGVVTRSLVSFDIGTSDFHHTGSTSGIAISGTTVMRVDLGTLFLTLTGRFTVERM